MVCVGRLSFVSHRDSRRSRSVDGKPEHDIERRLARHRDGDQECDPFFVRRCFDFFLEDITMSNARLVALGLSFLSLVTASSVEAGHRFRRSCCASTCCATAAPACCSTGAAMDATATTGSAYQSYSHEPDNSVAPAKPSGNQYVAPTRANQSSYDAFRGDRKASGRY